MDHNERLDLEFAYTSYADSCRDIYSLHYRCRRPHGHGGRHAAGFGAKRVHWYQHAEHGQDAPPVT